MARRNTIQCALVLETVQRLKCHPTADEIYVALASQHPNISRGTVYRNLRRLCESGRIRKREIPSGADRFDHLCDDHYHIKCLECSRVFDVEMTYLSHLEQRVQEAHGFLLTGHDVVFKGICPDCQALRRHGGQGIT